MQFKNIIYALAALSFSVIIGAGIYEHIALWPVAFSEPPKSLSVFQGPYRLTPAPFWMSIHPITLIFFVAALIANWRTNRKQTLLITIAGYMLILVVTHIYFVPELMELTGTPFSDTVDPSLQDRGSLWINLSLIRAAILIVLSLNLLLTFAKREAVS